MWEADARRAWAIFYFGLVPASQSPACVEFHLQEPSAEERDVGKEISHTKGKRWPLDLGAVPLKLIRCKTE